MGIYTSNWERFQKEEAARLELEDKTRRTELHAEWILDEQAEEHEYNEFWAVR